jgi:glutamate racemase
VKVGVFDSGLGGLTVVRALREHIDGLEIVYVADTAHAPYGEKTHEQIRHFSDALTRYLIDVHRIDAMIVACNTATSAAISHLRDTFPDLIIIGTEPGVKPALTHTTTHKIGVLATPATLAGDKYQELVDALVPHDRITLFEQACPGLVEQIEAGQIDTPKTTKMLEGWLSPMREAGVDTIVLGCTHYPLAAEAIERVMGYPVTLIETGEAIAQRLRSLLEAPERTDESRVSVFATGEIDHQAVKRILVSDRLIEIKRVEELHELY